jgi:tetratricopeptide (TPR) repeat protein
MSLAAIPPLAHGQEVGYGPYDYTNPDHYYNKLPVVEAYHFNRDVETLTGTMQGGSIAGHLWYVIRSFPNHHRALNSMAKLWRNHMAQNQVPYGIDADKTPKYLFDRAMQFAPHDAVVPLLYGMHLYELGDSDTARELFVRAQELGEGQPELQYNLGLMYMKLGNPSQALIHAEKAYQLGYPLPGLRNLLVEAGVWQEPALGGTAGNQ